MKLDHLIPPSIGHAPWRVSAVALDVSGRCNMACRYCAEAAMQPRRCAMSTKVLEAAWRLLFPDGKPRPGSSIRLGSGEPLLAFPLINRLARLIERSGGSAAEGRPAIFLTTNGTLLNTKLREWLIRSGWNVKVSLDGPGPLHDRWRIMPGGTGTFERVAEAVRELARRMPERLSVTAVLCRGADPEEVFNAIVALGVRRIELVPVAHCDASVLPGKVDIRRYELFVRSFAYQARDDKNGLPSLVRFENCVRRAMGYDLHRVPCGAGRTFLGVAPDGTLYPCFRFIGIPEYRLGRLPGSPDAAPAKAFERGPGKPYENRAECSECKIAPLCGGPCFAVAEMFGPGCGAPLEAHCGYTRANATWAVWLVEQLRKRNAERLFRYLPESVRQMVPTR
jgi:uncharacterized protein